MLTRMKGFVKNILEPIAYKPEYTDILPARLDFEHKETKVQRILHSCDFCIVTIGASLLSGMGSAFLTTINASSYMAPFTSLIGAYTIMRYITERASKTKELDKKQPKMSREFAKTLQYALAQGVVLSAIPLFKNLAGISSLHYFFNVKDYIAWPMGAWTFLDPPTNKLLAESMQSIVHVGARDVSIKQILCKSEDIYSILLGVGILAPACLTTVDYITNMAVHNRITGINPGETKYGIGNVIRSMIVNSIKVGLPYFLCSSSFGFAFAGLGFGTSYFLDQVFVVTIDKEYTDEEKKDLVKAKLQAIGESLYKSIIYSAFGMVVYPILPIYAPTIAFNKDDALKTNFGAEMIFTAIAIALADAFLRHYVLPSLTKRKRKNGENVVGMTIKEKIDFALVALTLGAVLGSSYEYRGFAADSNTGLTAQFQGVGFLSGLWPIFVAIASMILVKKFRTYTDKQEKLKDSKLMKVLHSFLSITPGMLMVTTAFKIVPADGAIAMASHGIETFFKENGLGALVEAMQAYEQWAGISILVTLARAFCLTFVLYGVSGLVARSYEAVTGDRFNAGEDLSKRHYMLTFILTRMPFEILKTSIKFCILIDPVLLQEVGEYGAATIANIAGGAIMGVFNNVAEVIKGNHSLKKLNESAGKQTIGYTIFQFLRPLYDQISYWAISIAVSAAGTSLDFSSAVTDTCNLGLNIIVAEIPQSLSTTFVLDHLEKQCSSGQIAEK